MSGQTSQMRIGFLALAPISLALATIAHAKTPVVGQLAPDFKAKTIDGKVVTLADLRGQVVLINFWATWCVPCKHELPLIDGYYRATKDHGFTVLAVTTEDSLQMYQLAPLAKVLSFPLVKSFHGPYEPLTGVPTNYIIGRDGVLRYAKSGAFSLDDLNALMVPLLNERAPSTN